MARRELATVAIWPTMTRLPEQLRAPTERLTACCAQFRPPERAGGQQPTGPSVITGSHHGALLVAAGQIDAFLLAGADRGIWLPWCRSSRRPAADSAT